MKTAGRALTGWMAALMLAGAVPMAAPLAGRHADPPAAAEKQERRTKWWKDEAVCKELSLSTAQSDKIDQIWESTVPSIRAAHSEMEGLEAELSRLIRENTADEKVVALQIDRVEALRSQINKARSLMLYRMHRELSPKQHETLRKIFEARRKEREEREAREAREGRDAGQR